MSWRTTLSLVVIALGLAGFILILERLGPRERGADDQRPYVLNIDRNDVNRVEIRDGESAILLTRNQDGWRMIQPVTDLADQKTIDSLLNDIQFLPKDDAITNLGKGNQKKEQLKNFGLLKPRLQVGIGGKDINIWLQFGESAALSGHTYLKLKDSDAAYVTTDDLKQLVSRSADAFRDHHLTSLLNPEIQRMIVHSPSGEIELERQQDDWNLVRPVALRADSGAVDQILNAINSTSIERFIPDEQAPGFTNESVSRSITLVSDDQKIEIRLDGTVSGEPSKQLAKVSGRPSVFVIPESLSVAVTVGPSSLRDRRITRLNPDMIDRITIEQAGQKRFVLSREEENWSFLPDPPTDPGLPANDTAINALVNLLNTQEVSAFVTDGPVDLERYGLANPAARIRLSSYASENTAEANAGEEPLATLDLGRREGDITYGRIEEEGSVFALSNKVVDAVPISRIDYRSLHVVSLDREDLQEITVQPGPKIVRGKGGHWEAQNGIVDENTLQSFLNTLVTLKADRWFATPSADSRLDHPAGTITVHASVNNQAFDFQLLIGPPNQAGQRYGTETGSDGIFLIDRSTSNVIGSLFSEKRP